jgi:hypothetical protein
MPGFVAVSSVVATVAERVTTAGGVPTTSAQSGPSNINPALTKKALITGLMDGLPPQVARPKRRESRTKVTNPGGFANDGIFAFPRFLVVKGPATLQWLARLQFVIEKRKSPLYFMRDKAAHGASTAFQAFDHRPSSFGASA